MKKIMALLFAICFVLPLVACGSQSEEQTEKKPQVQQTETNAPDEKPVDIQEETEPQQTEAAAEATESSDVESFDSSWTTNSAAMNVPEPPAEYKIAEKQSSETFCLIEINSATFDAIKEYGEYLQSCGFDIDVSVNATQSDDGRDLYNFKGKNANGCSVSIDFSQLDGDFTLAYMEIYVN